jgi:CheY-like chemotaxis protein
MLPNYSTQQGRILIVDDEPQVLAVAKAILNAHGFDIETTHTGESALEMIRAASASQRPYTLCILDLTMPDGLSGFETMEQITQIVPSLPVIACSGYFQEDSRELCRALGFTDILQKPYALEHLVATVRHCLHRSQSTSSFYATGA